MSPAFPPLPVLVGPAGGLFPPARHVLLDTCGSTNDEVRDRIRAGEPEGTLVLADRQAAGRGRLGRSWHSPGGRNVHLTLLLRPRLAPDRLPLVTLALALAARSAARAAGVQAALKWPNDLVVRRTEDRPLRKLAGIACEAVADGDRVALAAGIGVNVDLDADELPADIVATATSVRIETGRPGDRAALVADLLEAFAPLYLGLQRDGGAAVLRGYRGALDTLGRPVRVDVGERIVEGIAVDVGEGGQLRVRGEGGGIEEIVAGDVGF